MPERIKGVALGEAFYLEAARPILEKHFPQLPHSAALIAWSSEVLGYDDEESTDHNWGPRFILFLSKENFDAHAANVERVLAAELPVEFRGYPTHYAPLPGHDWPVFQKIDAPPVSHKIDIDTIENYFGWYLGCADPLGEIKAADWLSFSEHKLLALTSGKVFHDGLGTLEAVRRKFAYYPEQIWRYLLACEWKYIAEEEAFVGRAGFVGDELGSSLVAARIVRHLMRLCFLMEKQYTPYSKWFGTAFSRLGCGAALVPMFREVLLAVDWKEREARLSRAYEAVARLHNQMGLTRFVPEQVSKHGRPYMIIHAGRFAGALFETINDPEIERTGFFGGSVNQFVAADNEVSNVELCRRLKVLYEPRQPES